VDQSSLNFFRTKREKTLSVNNFPISDISLSFPKIFALKVGMGPKSRQN